MSYQVNTEEAKHLHTLRDMVRWAVTQFNQANLIYGHGTDNAWDEAINLVLSGLHLPPDIDINVLDGRITPTENEQLAQFIKRRVEERVPVPYLVKEAWFVGLNFYVDERVLIPRSPIAELLEDEFSPWVEEQNVSNILDMCTGSACIAIGAAITFPEAKVDAVDYDSGALEVAKMNVERFGLEDCVECIQSDLFNNLQGRQYDIIIANPPYVSQEEYDTLPPEYMHEPQKALLTGEDGLELVNRILRDAENHLTPNGILVVEVGFTQSVLEERFPGLPFTWLQFERGGEGVFLLTFDELREFKHLINQ